MLKFADLPPTERWVQLDAQLPTLIAAHAVAATIDPTDEVEVEAIAARHGATVRAMVRQLRALGGKPYKIGKAWMIRRQSLAIALAAAEVLDPESSPD